MPATSPRQILRYCRRFGLRTGLSAARLHGRAGRVAAVRLPDVAHPIWARTGTSDADTFAEVFVAREYDLPFPDLDPGQVLDLGANVGYASITFAARWPRAQILAVEPDAANFQLLQRNAQPWGRIVPLRAAVWSHPTQVRVANPDDAANAYRMSEAAGPAESVPAHTVPQLMEKLGAARLGLLKIDVEGAEEELFRHGAEWLDRVDVMVVELHDRITPGCAQALYGALQGRRFRQEIVGQNLAIDLRL